MDLATLQNDEAEAQAQLQEDAAQAAQGAISRATLAAASQALDTVAADVGRGSIGEPAADLRDLRADPALRRALEADLEAEAVRLSDAVVRWIASGWLAEAEGQAEILRGQSLEVEISLTDADRADLQTFPVQGYAPAEIVGNLVYTLRRDFLGALGRGISQAKTPGGIVVPLAQVSADHASRCGRAAGECFLAGTQAARIGIGAELARALGVKAAP